MARPFASRAAGESPFTRWDYVAFILLSGASVLAIARFGVSWFLDPVRHDLPVLFLGLTLILVARLSIHQFQWMSLCMMKKPAPAPPRPGWRIGVATTFVKSAESIEMLEQTVSALVAMDYPHDTWVLDEDDHEEVRALCDRLGAFHFSRRSLPRYRTESGRFQDRSKHGNYNAWLDAIGFARYDIVTGFDPDHIPRPDFLLHVLGHFDDDRVGYVQAPQAYYNQDASFIARGAAEETYPYYSSVQMANYALGFPVVTGCHNTHRAAALREVGGFAAHDADDHLISLHYRVRGWRGVYVPEILARGLTPVDWSGYMSQQRRWARSILDIKLRIFPKLSSGLPPRERFASFLQGLYYLRGLSSAFGILVLCALLVTRGENTVVSRLALVNAGWLIAVLQVCSLYRQRFFLDPRRERGLRWRAAMLEYAKWPYFLVAALEAIVGRREPYALTRKVRSSSEQKPVLWPHLIVAAAVGGCWALGAALGELPALVELWAALIVALSLGLWSTERLRFPQPYERRLSTWWCYAAGVAAPETVAQERSA